MVGSRGRIVMLVDNNVTPDSRVQKEARSAAERGWDVTLLGHYRAGSKRTWKLGSATVQLVSVPTPLNQRPHVRRAAPLRSPLAYSRPATASYRRQLIRAEYADLRVRRARFVLDQQTGQGKARRRVGAGADSARLFADRAGLALRRRWTTLRAERTDQLEIRRKAMTSPLDRFTTAFWRQTMGQRAWRRLDPTLWDWELAYGEVIDQLKPDIIHANDFRMVGIGARAALRARARGRDVRLVWDAHEFLPGMRPWDAHPRWHVAQIAHEREYAPLADAVVTVSDVLAEMLIAEHGLTERPAVVLNAPEVFPVDAATTEWPSVRRACGLGTDVPLLVYSGTASPPRGLEVLVEALAELAECHIALVVSKPKSDYVQSLVRRAEELGVNARLHLVGYVPTRDIVPFLSTADIGVIPILHFPNHEISLITKFLEYSQARLPVVVSDVRTMSDTVRSTGQGEVFTAGSTTEFVTAVRTVLADPGRYRRAYDQPHLLDGWTWESAADTLDDVYSTLRAEQLGPTSR